MSRAFQDLRHSIRPLWKEKPFTFTVLVTLAVCVGANAAIFSVVKTVLLSPLPFPYPDQLVVLYNSYPGAGVPRASNGATDYFVRRERVTSFSHLAQYQSWGNTVGDPGETTRVQSMRVTASYFPLLGVRPLLGRSFAEEEMHPGSARCAYGRRRRGSRSAPRAGGSSGSCSRTHCCSPRWAACSVSR